MNKLFAYFMGHESPKSEATKKLIADFQAMRDSLDRMDNSLAINTKQKETIYAQSEFGAH